ncbi:MAG: 3-phosphoglycerate dehydrogenase [Clostridia bacterium]|nr:3-phosphoglycerate dehydrogenase [Clostridia bacterium]
MKEIQILNSISPIASEAMGSEYTLVKESAAPEGILVRSFDMHDMDVPASVLAIARAGAGTNNIPIDEMSQKGIAVFNTPGANANAVAELVLTGLLLASRDVVSGIEWARSLAGQEGVAKLVEKGKSQFVGPEIAGKTLGVIGLGAIGARVANNAVHLGMNVVGYDPFLTVKNAFFLSRQVKYTQSIQDIWKDCDYVTLHLPLNNETRGTVNAEVLGMMKDGAALLNFARGELVDTDALLEAVASGKLRRYVTDFPNEKLLNVKGVVAIPHLGASTPESEDNCARMAGEELKAYIEEGVIRNSVNLPAMELPPLTGHRISVIHKNVPNILSAITSAVAGVGLNIENMVNSSRGTMACTVLDTHSPVPAEAVAAIAARPDMLKVRVIK